MMFHRGEQNFVALFQIRPAPALGDKVDRFGGSAGEDYFFIFACIEKLPYRLPASFVQIGSMLRKPVNATVNIGIRLGVKAALGLDYLARLLGGGSVIQVNQTFAAHGPRKYRKIAGVVGNRCDQGGSSAGTHEMSPSNAPPGNRFRTVVATRRRMGSSVIRLRACAAKAYVMTPCACASDSPRDRR